MTDQTTPSETETTILDATSRAPLNGVATHADAAALQTAPPDRPSQVPTCGRILLIYSEMWEGPRPGIVQRAERHPDGRVTATVNLLVDGSRDVSMLLASRLASTGTTLSGVPVADSRDRDPQGRELALLAVKDLSMGLCSAIAEWPRRE